MSVLISMRISAIVAIAAAGGMGMCQSPTSPEAASGRSAAIASELNTQARGLEPPGNSSPPQFSSPRWGAAAGSSGTLESSHWGAKAEQRGAGNTSWVAGASEFSQTRQTSGIWRVAGNPYEGVSAAAQAMPGSADQLESEFGQIRRTSSQSRISAPASPGHRSGAFPRTFSLNATARSGVRGMPPSGIGKGLSGIHGPLGAPSFTGMGFLKNSPLKPARRRTGFANGGGSGSPSQSLPTNGLSGQGFGLSSSAIDNGLEGSGSGVSGYPSPSDTPPDRNR